jgi:hypothetical protein
MVVEGANDERLAIECDGNRYHGADQWADDMQRQRILERAGWVFWRCFASTFVRRSATVLEELLSILRERGIEPSTAEGTSQSLHCEFRRLRASELALSDFHNTTATENKKLSSIVGTGALNPSSATIDPMGTQQAFVSLNSQQVKEIQELPLLRESEAIETTLADKPERPQPRIPIPRNTYSEEALQVFLDMNGVTSEDNRGKNGALWVNLDEEQSEPARKLASWGFKYKAGRGWWKK